MGQRTKIQTHKSVKNIDMGKEGNKEIFKQLSIDDLTMVNELMKIFNFTVH